MKIGMIFSRILGRKKNPIDTNSRFFTFHQTVIGYRHMHEGIPCQDCSISYSDKEGAYQIISVADGHGSLACCRSEKGAQYITDIAKACLETFAIGLLKDEIPFSTQRQRRDCTKQLTNTVISKWYAAVKSDLEKNPLTEKELAQAGNYEKDYRRGEYLEHLYGTTLIAALRVLDIFILLQQGDGRCDVFYDDGSVEQPIPWDFRCESHVTTSMCDADATESIRSCILDLKKKKIIACYIGSDGIEDSYYDNEESQLGTHRFYKGLSCKLNEYGSLKFQKYLERQLREFSRNGSADDISVAGIVDLEEIEKHVLAYKIWIEQYDYRQSLKKSLELTNQKIVSMARKHSILMKQGNQAVFPNISYEDIMRYDAEYQELLQKKEKLRHLLDDEENSSAERSLRYDKKIKM